MRVTAVNRLRLRDVLVLHVASDTDDSDDTILRTFAAEMQRNVSTPIIILDETMTLESLSEDQMRAAGWVRATPNGAV